jgi:hypothetical protein
MSGGDTMYRDQILSLRANDGVKLFKLGSSVQRGRRLGSSLV